MSLRSRIIPFQCTDLESYLAFPFKILLIVGLGSYGDRDKKIGYYIYWAYSMLGVCFQVVTLFAVLYIIDWTDGILDDGVSQLLVMAGAAVRWILTSVAIIYASRKGRFVELLKVWKEYKLDQTMDEKEKKWAKRCIITVFFCFALMMIVSAIYSALPRILHSRPPRTTAPEETVKIMGSGLFTIGFIFGNFLYMTPQYIFFVIAILTACSWRSFGNCIQNMSNYDELFEYTIVKQKELARVVEKVNDIFNFYALAMFGANIPCVLSLLYSFTFAKCWDHLYQVAMGTALFSMVVALGILASACGIYDAAEAIYDKFYDRYSEQLLRQKATGQQANMVGESAIVLNHLRGAKIGVSPFGVFTIKKSVMMGVFSVMVTYYVTLCQFVYQPDAKLECRGRNETNGTAGLIF